MKERRPCFGLWAVLWMLAAIGVLVFFVVTPWVGRDLCRLFPAQARLYWPGLFYAWAIAIAYALALWQFYRLIQLISMDRSFSMRSAARMRAIARISAFAGAWFALGLVALAALRLFSLGAGMLLAFLCLVCAVVSLLAFALSRLIVRAADIKAENDFTV